MKRYLSAFLISILFIPAGTVFADRITFSGASDNTVEATSAAGAVVSFSVTALDASSTPLTLSCDHTSGDTFTLGTTTVVCSASDSSFATSTSSFGVGVVDTTPPSITPPAEQSFSTTTFPASPSLTRATATDLIDPNPVVTYSPISFSHGTTTVVWSATDSTGNVSTTTSQVGVFLHSEVSVDVPATCETTDSNGVVHAYEATSSTAYLGICALEAALASSSISQIELSNQYPSFGLFLTAISGVSADPNAQYWALYQNGSFASVGITGLPIVPGDTILFQLHDFSDINQGHQITITIHSLISTSTPVISNPSPNNGSGGSGGGGGISHAAFNTVNALTFLASKQNVNGSFGNSLISDWAAFSFASNAGGAPAAQTKLKQYLLTAAPILSSPTDYERHAMALQAIGINPYSGTPTNYIAPIVAAFDGTQIGDPSLDNDDIFALFPLLHAGYGPSDNIIQKTAAFILSRQKTNGSWDESPDMTAAAIQALGPLYSLPGLNAALGRAAGYLMASQRAGGGWSSIDSTSWVQTAINGIIEAHTPGFDTEAPWISSNGYYPTDVIAYAQQSDGAARPLSDSVDNRVWSTSYALVAASGKSWVTILQSFPKPITSGTGSGGGSSLGSVATSTPALVATSTPILIATSTEIVATSTEPIAPSTTTAVIASTTAALSTTSSPTPASISPPKKVKTVATSHPIQTPVNESAPPTPKPSQLASAAASQQTGGFLGTIWTAVTSFFSLFF